MYAHICTQKQVASTIARSPLVKTALYGSMDSSGIFKTLIAHTPLHLTGDANWGRILSAVGYSGVAHISPEKTNVSFMPTDGSKELKLLVNGEPESVDEERAVGVGMPP